VVEIRGEEQWSAVERRPTVPAEERNTGLRQKEKKLKSFCT